MAHTGIPWDLIDEDVAVQMDAPTQLRVLQEYATLMQVAEQRLARAVVGARKNGVMWSDIGAALGVSKQAAQQRYGRAL